MKLKSNQERLLEGLRYQLLEQVPRDPKKPNGAKHERVRSLLARAREALEMDISEVLVSASPDGFPSTTPGNGSPGGGKGGRMTMVIDDDGERDTVPTSSTERAAFAGTDPVWAERSQVVDELREVEAQLRHIDSAILRLSGALTRLDGLRGQTTEEASPQCWVASVAHGLPWDRDWEPAVSTRFENYLDTPWEKPRPVCRWVYDFTRRNRRLPERDELLQYLERGHVRVTA